MIVDPICERFKKEFEELSNSYDLTYSIVTEDDHIVVHAKIKRDFTNREHLKKGTT